MLLCAVAQAAVTWGADAGGRMALQATGEEERDWVEEIMIMQSYSALSVPPRDRRTVSGQEKNACRAGICGATVLTLWVEKTS